MSICKSAAIDRIAGIRFAKRLMERNHADERYSKIGASGIELSKPEGPSTDLTKAMM